VNNQRNTRIEPSRSGVPPLCISPGSIRADERRSVEDDARACAEAGFAFVSLRPTVTRVLSEEGRSLADLPRLLADAGVACAELTGLTFRRDPAVVATALEQVLPVLEVCPGAWVLVNYFTRLHDESLARLGLIADQVEARGGRMAIEFAPESGVDSIGVARQVAEHLGPHRCRVMVDTWHFSRGPSTFEDLEALPRGLLAYVQISDGLPASGEDMLTESMHRTWPGEGDIDLACIVQTLKDKDYDGMVCVEVLSSELQQLPVDEFLRLAYESTVRIWQ